MPCRPKGAALKSFVSSVTNLTNVGFVKNIVVSVNACSLEVRE